MRPGRGPCPGEGWRSPASQATGAERCSLVLGEGVGCRLNQVRFGSVVVFEGLRVYGLGFVSRFGVRHNRVFGISAVDVQQLLLREFLLMPKRLSKAVRR